ncbi:MAG: heme-binding protein [Cryomorphaceae bacterium]|nr:MAG: heme-binding protein [Cryomorphaceae bacterium]
MKSLAIILAATLVVFIVAQAFIMKGVSQTEKHAYEVLEQWGEVEVRRYATALFSSVELPDKPYREVSGSGFRVLAGYIFGGNESGEKIAMTSPVVMEYSDKPRMMFMVPSGYNEEQLPVPNDERISFHREDARIMAVVRFGGWADDAKIAEHRSMLEKVLADKNIAHNGVFRYMGYNPPYEVSNRRNEVAVQLVGYAQQEEITISGQ